MSANALFRPTFADLRAEIERLAAHDASPEDVDALIEQFLLAGGAAPAPCVDYDGMVTWLYRDAHAASVSVVGDIVGKNPAETRLTRLPGCDLFALTMQLPLDARLAYSFVVTRGASEQPELHVADPLNPKRMLLAGPLRSRSLLEMPNARRVPELEGADVDGELNVVYNVVSSADRAILARVWVYLPPDYDPRDRRYPALYFCDGESYLVSARAPQMMDALLAQGEVAPAIMVFVERSAGGGAMDDRLAARYAQFLADELVPWVDARYATSTDPQERVIGGAGANGTFSLYVALERPDVFGQALMQSPLARSFSRQVPALLGRNAGRGFGPPRCYVDVGRYEELGRVESVQALCTALLKGGAVLSYQDFGGDHGFAGWRTTLPDALRFHFGSPPLAAL